MIDAITPSSHCFGCTACQSVCPTDSIEFVEDKKGFLYPRIKMSCVNCEKCIRTCPANSPREIEDPKVTIAMQNIDTHVLRNSTSGGVFSLLAKQTLSKSGTIYGVVYDNKFNAMHIRATDEHEIEKMRGSKYIQSNLGKTFKSISEDLSKNLDVLFTGTPCQCDGLLRYLCRSNINVDNLRTVAVLCHGVPSPKIFKDHISFIEKERNKKIIHYSNREKVHGWHEHNECVFYEDGSFEWRTKLSQNFKDLFYQNSILRDSCYRCPYASKPFVSDITIGDFWGIEYLYPEKDDNKGTSIVFANTDKGKEELKSIYNESKAYEVNYEKSLLYNHHNPCKQPDYSLNLWEDYFEHGYAYIVAKYADYTLSGKAKWKLRQELRRLLVLAGIKRG